MSNQMSSQFHQHHHHHHHHHNDRHHELHKQEENQPSPNHKYSSSYISLLVVTYLCLFIGSVSSTLLSKYYFIHKGASLWVSTWVQSAGFPLLLFPIYLPYYLFNSTSRKPFSNFTLKIFTFSILIGLLLGVNNLLFSWGNSYLPVSTSSLLLSSQLVFTLILSVLIVGQRITYQNLNCVVLLTLSSVLLALGESHDRPEGLTKDKYFLGFICTIGAGLLFALYLPVMEKLLKRVTCYLMVVEMQLVMEAAATALAAAGMAVAGAFSQIKRESLHDFDKGEKVYWVTVFSNVVTWQLCFMGTAGMVFLTTSLTSGICMTALLTMNVLGGVLVYGDSFGGVKVVSTVLCTWGFCSYVYGMYLNMKNVDNNNNNQKKLRGEDDNNGTDPISLINDMRNESHEIEMVHNVEVSSTV